MDAMAAALEKTEPANYIFLLVSSLIPLGGVSIADLPLRLHSISRQLSSFFPFLIMYSFAESIKIFLRRPFCITIYCHP